MLILSCRKTKLCCHMKHLTQVQRYQIEGYIKSGYSNTEIAIKLGVNKSSISRELSRNSLNRASYDGSLAHKLYESIKRKVGSIKKKAKGELKERVEGLLRQDLSPEQITGRLRKRDQPSLSHACIYQLVWEDKSTGGNLYKHLRHSHKKKKKQYGKPDKRGKIPNRISIEHRPQIIDNKERIGDWEGDTIIGKNHKGAIVTLTERKSNYQLMKKVKNKNAAGVAKAIVEIMRKAALPVKSITFDNGKEFSAHERIAKLLNTEIYFAHPYSSWERGLNEYQNKLIRQYIPKKTDFSKVSTQRVNKIQDRLNSRPRKGLDFLTPEEFIAQELGIKTHALFKRA